MWGVEANLGAIRNWLGQQRPRGAAVPFETPALRMARVCADEHDGLIAILRDFANNGSIYVVPWHSLRLVVPMTNHDVALHQAVADNKATTPENVRAVIRDLALSGALGADAQAIATEEQQVAPRAADAELVLIHTLLRGCGVDFAIASGRWNARRARAAVAAAASTVEAPGKEIYQRIGSLARMLQPIGLVVAEGSLGTGWLRVLHGEIRDFGETVAAGAHTAPPGVSDDLTAIAASARQTAELSRFVLDALDYAVRDVAGTVRRWNEEAPVLHQAIERLAMTLDVWPPLMKAVQDTLRGPPELLGEEIRSLRSMAPRMPTAAKSAQ